MRITKEYLQKKALGFNTADDFDSVMAFFDVEEIRKWLCGDKFLEMGSSAGTVTRYLLEIADELDIVEGSLTGINRTKELLGDGNGKITYHHELWEDFEPKRPYTDIISVRSLEHAEDPVSLLKKMSNWITEDGRIHIIVPNATSLHRRIMVRNGKLTDLYSLRDRDFQVGHVQIFGKKYLENIVKEAGLRVVYSTDFFVKQVGTSEMGKISMDHNNDFVKSCYSDGKELHEQGLYGLGTQLYVVAERK